MFDDLRPHLIELRKRLGISVGSLIVMFFSTIVGSTLEDPASASINRLANAGAAQVSRWTPFVIWSIS